jgi:hypothetical protein
MDWMTGPWLLMRQDFSVCHSVETNSSSRTHPASCPLGARVLFSGVMWPGYEIDHLPPSRVEVKNAWSYTSTPPYSCISWCLITSQAQLSPLLLGTLQRIIEKMLWDTSGYYLLETEENHTQPWYSGQDSSWNSWYRWWEKICKVN